MRSFLIVIFAAALVSGSALFKRQASIPSCASSCLASADPSPCSSTDTLCLCVNQAYINATAKCVVKSCSAEEVTPAEAAGEALCKAAGIDPTNPFPTADICVHSTCDAQDVAVTEPAAQAVCRAVGVDITANPGAHPSGAASSASATGNATPATSVPGPTSATLAAATSPSATTNAAVAGLAIDKGLIVGGLAAFVAAFGM
ncbi:hypothetical protein M407DRAFT_216887 [Tulasnella calospora MUT 4182]|uniref:CFEM domain-containing protein n=1 Tax=Tulasnella calospora MUT 4182 TaxID=1051891 RepID=A0A0C3QAY8_9AGAM|nr:hypothetical protein M407DRAFT_216887 [Tulasnella calospora MUT 4182]